MKKFLKSKHYKNSKKPKTNEMNVIFLQNQHLMSFFKSNQSRLKKTSQSKENMRGMANMKTNNQKPIRLKKIISNQEINIPKVHSILKTPKSVKRKNGSQTKNLNNSKHRQSLIEKKEMKNKIQSFLQKKTNSIVEINKSFNIKFHVSHINIQKKNLNFKQENDKSSSKKTYYYKNLKSKRKEISTDITSVKPPVRQKTLNHKLDNLSDRGQPNSNNNNDLAKKIDKTVALQVELPEEKPVVANNNNSELETAKIIRDIVDNLKVFPEPMEKDTNLNLLNNNMPSMEIRLNRPSSEDLEKESYNRYQATNKMNFNDMFDYRILEFSQRVSDFWETKTKNCIYTIFNLMKENMYFKSIKKRVVSSCYWLCVLVNDKTKKFRPELHTISSMNSIKSINDKDKEKEGDRVTSKPTLDNIEEHSDSFMNQDNKGYNKLEFDFDGDDPNERIEKQFLLEGFKSMQIDQLQPFKNIDENLSVIQAIYFRLWDFYLKYILLFKLF